MLAVFQPQGGFLLPERCIVNYAQAARDSGAVIHTEEKVVGWEKTWMALRSSRHPRATKRVAL